MAASTDARLGIEPIAQPITEDIDGEHQKKQTTARKRDDPPGALDVLSADADDRAPTRRRWLDAETKERKAGLEQDHQAEFRGGDDQQGPGDVRQYMAKQDARRARTGKLGCLDIGQGGDLQRLAERDARVAG